MARNPHTSTLDTSQIIKRVVNELNDTIRIEFGDTVGIDVNLDASEDSVTTVPEIIHEKTTIDANSSGEIIAPLNCCGITAFSLYAKGTSSGVQTAKLTLQVSPSETDDVWFETGINFTVDNVFKALGGLLALRCRVVLSSPITDGSYDVYLVGAAT